MTVVLENEYVRVLSVRVAPGDKEPWHTHTWPARGGVFSPAAVAAPLARREKMLRAETHQATGRYDSDSRPRHSVENLGKEWYQAYRVELKPTTTVAVARN